MDGEYWAEKYGYWGEHPDHPVEDWRYLVANGDAFTSPNKRLEVAVRCGYWEWVAGRAECED